MTYIHRLTLLVLLLCSFSFFYRADAQTQALGESSGIEISERSLDGSTCAFTPMHEKAMRQPAFQQRQKAIEEMLYQRALEQIKKLRKEEATGIANPAKAAQVLTIPLVVHIVHLSTEPNPGDGPSNPTDAQIMAGIEHLNQAYRNIGVFADNGHNPLPSVQSVDVEIEFCLAQRDINGNPSNGILRYENDDYSSMDINDDDPQMQQWVNTQNGGAYPGTDYANVWLVNEICTTSGGSQSCNIAGYAYFPGNHGAVNNGVINKASYWGSSTNNSKIHIHEFGHYLNLYHTFQGGCSNGDCLTNGDRICDTPPDNRLSFSNCGSSDNSCTTDADDTSGNNPFTSDQDDLYENYMDYTSTSCQNTFTQNQKERMRAALMSSRASLLNSAACVPVDGPEAALIAILFPGQSLCSDSFTPIVEVQNNGNQAITSLSFNITLDGVAQAGVNWSGNIQPDQAANINLATLNLTTNGSHTLEVEIINTNGSPDPFTNNNLKALSFQNPAPVSSLPYCENLETNSIPSDWIIDNPDNDVTFEVVNIETCAEMGSYSLALQTWGEFPDQNTVETLLTQSIDLTNYSNVSLSFDVAHAITYSNFNTILDIAVSTDCGLNYTSLYNKASAELATKYVQASNGVDPAAFFIPEDCEDWKNESIPLDNYVGQKMLIRIQASTADISGSSFGYYWGNNLYLDNICINGQTSGNACTQDEYVLFDSPIPADTYDNVRAIFAAGTLAQNASVTFSASEVIYLMPGFEATPGNSFSAFIAACGASARTIDSINIEPAVVAETLALDSKRELLRPIDLRIFPNPSDGQTSIQYYLPDPTAQLELTILDVNGKVIQRINAGANDTGWHDIHHRSANLKSGIYIIRLQANGQVVSRKMVIL